MGNCGSSLSSVADNRTPPTLRLRAPGDNRSKDVHQLYVFEKVLDKGSTSTVHLVRDRSTEQLYACKSLNKQGLTAAELHELRMEMQVLRHLGNHPHIVEVKEVFEDKMEVHLVMALCSGGELFQRLARRRRVTEAEAAKCIQVVMRVVHHCHSLNVIHRDVKPENFLLESPDSPLWCLRAIDFGSSCFVTDDAQLSHVVGSPHYVAPEVLKGAYNREIDVWSAGVMLYILLSGRPPFDGDNDEQVLLRILSAPLDLRTGAWAYISSDARDLVRRMLARNPRRRITADQVLTHPWICKYCEDAVKGSPPVPELLVRMRAFVAMTNIKRQALKKCARLVPEDQVKGLREIFTSIDRDHDGMLTLSELLVALRKRGARDISQEEVNAILSFMSGDQVLQFEDFLAATMNPALLEKSEAISKVFQALDKDGSGLISREALEDMLTELPADRSHAARNSGDSVTTQGRGRHNGLSKDEYRALLQELQGKREGLVDYSEFCEMLLSPSKEEADAMHGRKQPLIAALAVESTPSSEYSMASSSYPARGSTARTAAALKQTSSLANMTYPELDSPCESSKRTSREYQPHVVKERTSPLRPNVRRDSAGPTTRLAIRTGPDAVMTEAAADKDSLLLPHEGEASDAADQATAADAPLPNALPQD